MAGKLRIPQFDASDVSTEWTNTSGNIYKLTSKLPTSEFSVFSLQAALDSFDANATITIKKSNDIDGTYFNEIGNVYLESSFTEDVSLTATGQSDVFFETTDVVRAKYIDVIVETEATAGTITFYDDLK